MSLEVPEPTLRLLLVKNQWCEPAWDQPWSIPACIICALNRWGQHGGTRRTRDQRLVGNVSLYQRFADACRTRFIKSATRAGFTKERAMDAFLALMNALYDARAIAQAMLSRDGGERAQELYDQSLTKVRHTFDAVRVIVGEIEATNQETEEKPGLLIRAEPKQTPDDPAVSEAYRIIQKAKKALTGKEIMAKLKKSGFSLVISTFYRHIAPILKDKYKVKNTRSRGGYHV